MSDREPDTGIEHANTMPSESNDASKSARYAELYEECKAKATGLWGKDFKKIGKVTGEKNKNGVVIKVFKATVEQVGEGKALEESCWAWKTEHALEFLLVELNKGIARQEKEGNGDYAKERLEATKKKKKPKSSGQWERRRKEPKNR